MKFTPRYFNPGLSLETGANARVVLQYDKDESKSLYVYDAPLVLAVNVAMATRRPLLLVGEPGSGKTTLARNVALFKGWAYYHYTVSSRSQAGELLWDVDTLSRLNDAYDRDHALLGEEYYVQPGPLWWAIAPTTAKRRGLPDPLPAAVDKKHPRIENLELPDPPGHRSGDGAVLLIDELDKAEPDVPNDLLEVLDTRQFKVKGRAIVSERKDILIFITTNVERELPAAFMRRCVVFRIPDPPEGWFAEIAAVHEPTIPRPLATAVEERLREARKRDLDRGARPPGAAEYLDALRALSALNVTGRADTAMQEAWDQIERSVFGKQDAIGSI
jgi:MoxR-like ATPase